MKTKQKKKIWDVTLIPLSPVHIGSGKTLSKGIDFVESRILNHELIEEKVIQEKSFDQYIEAIEENALKNFLGKDFNKLTTSIGIQSAAKELHLFQADAFNNPYIPGSSIKGAIRTLFYKYATQNNQNTDETQVFGKMQEDWMRGFQIGDCPVTSVCWKNSKLFNLVGENKIEPKPYMMTLEIVAEGEQQFRVTLDPEILDDFHPHIQGNQAIKTKVKTDFIQVLQDMGKERISEEIQFYKNFENSAGYSNVVNFYEKLLKMPLSKNEVIFHLGWGTGWKGVTGNVVSQKELQSYPTINTKMGKYKLSEYSKDNDDNLLFPKTRRLSYSGDKYNINADEPFGWVKLTFQDSQDLKEEKQKELEIKLKLEKKKADEAERINNLSKVEQLIEKLEKLDQSAYKAEFKQQLDQFKDDDQKKLASYFKERFIKEGSWEGKKAKNPKQATKIQKIQTILGE
ncbi:MAG: CRISPR/Cas system CSM-associated protein Csm5 (group 7 of RAMP superfamily) [bacterium]|jgi:CRISPR/Cas system CSM-associated protein Csm5 (group 7 of RAMP superfamily)